MVYSRLSRRLRELQVPEFATYLAMLEQRQDEGEWQLPSSTRSRPTSRRSFAKRITFPRSRST
jgi:hypothetical protein